MLVFFLLAQQELEILFSHLFACVKPRNLGAWAKRTFYSLTTSFKATFLSLTKSKIMLANRPFYSCVLSYLAMNASETGVDLTLIDLSAFLM